MNLIHRHYKKKNDFRNFKKPIEFLFELLKKEIMGNESRKYQTDLANKIGEFSILLE